MRLREATAADRDAVLQIGVDEETAWFGEPDVSAAEVGEWVDSEGGLEPGRVAVDDDGRVRGFASPGRQEAVFLADPGATPAVVDALMPWLLAARDDVDLMVAGGDAVRIEAFARYGLRHVASSFTLARPAAAGPVPAASFPEGVDVAPYVLGDDDEAVHRLVYVDAAWASIPGHSDRDLDAWRDKERPCRSLFLARRDGRPVGWIAGRVLDNGRGYISTLAVAEGERGRGLGRALLLRAFADLQGAGATDLTLGVEAHNEAALGLYRSVGMHVEREWKVYSSE